MNKIKEEYSHLSDGEKEALMQDLLGKMDNMENLMKQQEDENERRLQEALAKRRKKKENVNKALGKLNEKRLENELHYGQKIMEIAEKE